MQYVFQIDHFPLNLSFSTLCTIISTYWQTAIFYTLVTIFTQLDSLIRHTVLTYYFIIRLFYFFLITVGPIKSCVFNTPNQLLYIFIYIFKTSLVFMVFNNRAPVSPSTRKGGEELLDRLQVIQDTHTASGLFIPFSARWHWLTQLCSYIT